MRIAITGATGFLGRYLVDRLSAAGHECACWYRRHVPPADRDTPSARVNWIRGELGDASACEQLLEGCAALVHAALHHPGGGYRGSGGSLEEFVHTNICGTIQLFETARRRGLSRIVFISTCAVHERILDDRPLDEAHPLWPTSHYGAHKAAIEKFVHSYGYGHGLPVCALRPTGIYGLARPVEHSRWFDLVRRVVRGQEVHCERGGKEVHARDVARAVELLLEAPADRITGEAFNCYDLYVSEYDVALLAKELSGSDARVSGQARTPRHQIDTRKLRALGMTFGGRPLLEQTIAELVAAARG